MWLSTVESTRESLDSNNQCWSRGSGTRLARISALMVAYTEECSKHPGKTAITQVILTSAGDVTTNSSGSRLTKKMKRHAVTGRLNP